MALIQLISAPQVLDDGPAGLLPVGERSLPLSRPRLGRLLDHHHTPGGVKLISWEEKFCQAGRQRWNNRHLSVGPRPME